MAKIIFVLDESEFEKLCLLIYDNKVSKNKKKQYSMKIKKIKFNIYVEKTNQDLSEFGHPMDQDYTSKLETFYNVHVNICNAITFDKFCEQIEIKNRLDIHFTEILLEKNAIEEYKYFINKHFISERFASDLFIQAFQSNQPDYIKILLDHDDIGFQEILCSLHDYVKNEEYDIDIIKMFLDKLIEESEISDDSDDSEDCSTEDCIKNADYEDLLIDVVTQNNMVLLELLASYGFNIKKHRESLIKCIKNNDKQKKLIKYLKAL